eukprot:2813330-Alexandrium_andersonii.AAC.1
MGSGEAARDTTEGRWCREEPSSSGDLGRNMRDANSHTDIAHEGDEYAVAYAHNHPAPRTGTTRHTHASSRTRTPASAQRHAQGAT